MLHPASAVADGSGSCGWHGAWSLPYKEQQTKGLKAGHHSKKR
jgi:hypothetical protein